MSKATARQVVNDVTEKVFRGWEKYMQGEVMARLTKADINKLVLLRLTTLGYPRPSEECDYEIVETCRGFDKLMVAIIKWHHEELELRLVLHDDDWETRTTEAIKRHESLKVSYWGSEIMVFADDDAQREFQQSQNPETTIIGRSWSMIASAPFTSMTTFGRAVAVSGASATQLSASR